MDNNKKLLEGLLKADGINPAGATESERIAFIKMLDEQSESKQPKPGSQPDIWRIIMKSRITKLAAAAVIVIAVFIVINQFGGSINGVSVALAEVVRKIEQMQTCVFKKNTTVTSEDGKTNKFDSLVYYTEAGIREDVYDSEKITSQIYVKPLDGILVGLEHTVKVYKEVELTTDDIEKMSPISLKNIVNRILSKGKYKKLGKKTVDGVLSEGFEINDKRAMLSMDKDKIENVVMCLWVDVNTNLPVRVELDGVFVLSNNSKANMVMYDPKWNVELEPGFFEPKIPVDYMKLRERGLIGINLENWPVLKVTSGMPAEKAGVKDEDVVLKVNGNDISHIKSSGDALSLLLGKAGEKVVLAVKRGEQTLTFEIERVPISK